MHGVLCESAEMSNDDNVILFDGECNLCDSTVQFIIKRDSAETFKFASLQSNVGQQLVSKYRIPGNLDSVFLLQKASYYAKSTAALRICRSLRGAWKLMYVFVVIPVPLRDMVYDFVARNRYRWFGKKNQCLVGVPGLSHRFLS